MHSKTAPQAFVPEKIRYGHKAVFQKFDYHNSFYKYNQWYSTFGTTFVIYLKPLSKKSAKPSLENY